MQGCLDWPRGQELIGWVWEPADPSKRLTVEVTLDGTLIRRREASDFRPDLPDAGVGDGRYAFSVELPAETFDGESHVLEVTSGGVHLSGSPFRFLSNYAGTFEPWTAGGREVRGTLTDQSRADAATRLIAELWDGARRLAETPVAQDRSFIFRLPPAMSLPARVELRAQGCRKTVVVADVEPPGYAARVLHDARELLTGSGEPHLRLAERLIPILASVPASEVRLRVSGQQTFGLAAARPDSNVPVDVIVVGTDGSDALLRTVQSVQTSPVEQAYEVWPCHDRVAGFAVHPERDCVLIAEGTTVNAGWLDRLRKAAYSSSMTATASPLVCQSRPSQGGEDRLETIPEPSRVCAYFRRDAWNEAGAKVARAEQLGWQHVAAGDVFAISDAAQDITQSTHLYAAVAASGSDVATLRCASGNTVWIGPRAYQLPEDRSALLDALRGVKRLRFNTAVNVPAELFALGIPYEIRVDDYSWICPRTNLVDATGRYCGEPSITTCEQCYADLGAREDWSDPGFGTVAELRDRSSQIFAGAGTVVFPSRDTERRISRYFGTGGRVDDAAIAPSDRTVHAGSVAVLGDEAILDACRYDTFKRGLPLAFANGAEAAVLLYANPAPDTSAVVSELPVVTFDIGATGEAVRTSGFGRVVPITANAAQINDALLSVLPSTKLGTDDVVDIVMPVYSGVAETRAAIESVLASSIRLAYELIVVFDNPGNAPMRDMLAEFSERITLLENAANVGFVASANRGMSLHPGRDVLLLNSDVVAPCSDWLDRIRRAAYASPRHGTVTPFSNNATICSYPRFCRDNPLPEGWSVTGLDAHCRQTLSGVTLELPTTVGFCMYIRADCLAETGLFDVQAFGQGYGEENDFCMRAAAKGWKHVLAADVFVQHVGSVSFGGAAIGRAAAAYEKVKNLHPEYGPAVERFLAEDPVLPLRRKLDLVRLKARHNTYCVASNKLPGGTERHVQEVAEAARLRGEHVVTLRYGDGEHVEIEGFDNQRYRLPEESMALRTALRELGVARLHIHQTVDAPPALFDLGLPYEVTVHDYAWICPQIKLIDRTGQYCGEPPVHVCEACFASLGPHPDWPSVSKRMFRVDELRAQSKQHLEQAEKVYFPSHDVAQRMARYANVAAPVVRLHDERPPAARRWRRSGNEPARIVFIGGLTQAKGFDILHSCAFEARKRGLPLEFTVAGACANPRRLKDLGVRVLGPYLEGEIYGILSEIQPHIAFFPGQWPETFSYTLSIAFDAGVWPVAYELGAIAERVKRYSYGRLLALDTPIANVNDMLWNEA